MRQKTAVHQDVWTQFYFTSVCDQKGSPCENKSLEELTAPLKPHADRRLPLSKSKIKFVREFNL